MGVVDFVIVFALAASFPHLAIACVVVWVVVKLLDEA